MTNRTAKPLLPHPAAPGYLNTASIGLPPAATVDALSGAIEEWADGHANPMAYDEPVDASRATFARLVGVDPANVAIGSQVSAFAGMIASSLPAGSRVVAAEEDFTSVLFPLLAPDHLDVTLVPLDRLTETIDAHTTLVAVSAVQSADGRIADLDAIAQAAEHHGAATLIDATQAVGWYPLDAGRFDFVICDAYKWLLSPKGTTFLTVRPERVAEITAIFAGWYAGGDRWGDTLYGGPLWLAPGAHRFDVSPGWLAWVGTRAALAEIERIGVPAIHAHDVGLANLVRSGVGLPAGDSAVVSLRAPGLAERLQEAGISAATRAGFVRLAFHLYNDQNDVDRVVEVLTTRSATG